MSFNQHFEGTPLPTHDWSWRRGLWPAYLKWMKATGWPILVGPWRGEVGFEVLYWIPWLERMKKQGIAPERMIPISRGGASIWYGTTQGLELYAMRTPQQVRVQRRIDFQTTKVQKQLFVGKFDRDVITDAAETLKLGRQYHVIHPSWMYHVLAPFWTGRKGPWWLNVQAAFPGLSVPPIPQTLTLPAAYVTCRFYGRETWPWADKQVRAATEATVLKMADQYPVVLLNNPVNADEHADIPLPTHPNLIYLRDLVNMRAETNLAIQSAVIAGSQGFVGPYGGLAQLALRIGKPSVSFYQHWGGTAMTHLNLSDIIASQYNVGFDVIRLQDLPKVMSVCPEIFVKTPEQRQMLDTKALTPPAVEVKMDATTTAPAAGVLSGVS